MNNEPKLTVGIPTYNGIRYIREALDGVIAQCLKLPPGRVEILISDNASTDGTGELMLNYREKHPGLISYFRNDANLGPSRNGELLFARARGEYVWLLSDDDAFTDNALERVLGVLDKYGDLAIVFCNYAVYDVNLKNLVPDTRENINEDALCENGDEFFIKTRFLCGLMSSVIIRRRDWLETGKLTVEGFIFFEVIVKTLARGFRSYIIADKLVKLRVGNARWGYKYYGYGFNLIRMFKSMPALGYSKKTAGYMIGNMKKANLRALLIANAAGLNNKMKMAEELISAYGNYPSFWMLDLPALFIPNFICRFLYISAKGIRDGVRALKSLRRK